MSKPTTTLPPELVAMLREESCVFLTTLNAETKKPQMSVVSWVWADEDGKRVKIAVGHKGTSLTNIQADPHVVIGTIGPETCYSITGKASISDIFERTMKFRIITVEVEEVEDIIFYGGKLTALPAFEKTYNAELAQKLDNDVRELFLNN